MLSLCTFIKKFYYKVLLKFETIFGFCFKKYIETFRKIKPPTSNLQSNFLLLVPGSFMMPTHRACHQWLGVGMVAKQGVFYLGCGGEFWVHLPLLSFYQKLSKPMFENLRKKKKRKICQEKKHQLHWKKMAPSPRTRDFGSSPYHHSIPYYRVCTSLPGIDNNELPCVDGQPYKPPTSWGWR